MCVSVFVSGWVEAHRKTKKSVKIYDPEDDVNSVLSNVKQTCYHKICNRS